MNITIDSIIAKYNEEVVRLTQRAVLSEVQTEALQRQVADLQRQVEDLQRELKADSDAEATIDPTAKES